MLKHECRIGMKVRFGRKNGEKTLGIIVKLNDKAAKVETLEDRGSRNVGVVWGVAYSLLERTGGPSDDAQPAPKLEYSPFQDAADQHILEAILVVYSQLSVENLTCDGELPRAQVLQRYNELQNKLTALFTAFGRQVSETEVYAWYAQRKSA